MANGWPLVRSLIDWDEYMLFADFASYVEARQRVGRTFCDRRRWTEMAILNVARMGKFSSDRSIREYAEQIWHIEPVRVDEAEPAWHER